MLSVFGLSCGAGDAPPRTARPSGAETRACTGLLASAKPEAALPRDVPAVDGATFYDKQRQGRTTYYFATAPGADVVTVRDAGRAKLAAAGYQRFESDEEGAAEADLQFDGPHEGSLQVTPLCAGHVRLRYRLSD